MFVLHGHSVRLLIQHVLLKMYGNKYNTVKSLPLRTVDFKGM
jgi:hypothetical protein